MSDHLFDAIVVGSGMTGGWAAKELAESGLKTLIIERGRHIEHGKDYITEHKPTYELPFRGRRNRRLAETEQFVQKQQGLVQEANAHFFANDKLNPFTHSDNKPFVWIRGHQLGGRSLMWARQCYRLSDLDFEANAKDGYGVDWPIRYDDIAPWYDYVEQIAGISGEANVSPRIPHGTLLPPMPLNEVELTVRQKLAPRYPDRPVTIARVAVLTRPLNGRAACHFCGPCSRGCSTGSYFSSLSATLPPAVASGNLSIVTDSIANKIIFDERTDRVTGVRVIDAKTHEETEYQGRLVFLCASAYESVRLLLNSRTPRFSAGLANSSGVLGHYLMDHHAHGGARGKVTGIKSRYYNGYRPCGIHVPRFRNVEKQHPDFVRGYQLGGGAAPLGWPRGIYGRGIGAAMKEEMRDPGPWMMSLNIAGEMLPRHENRMTIDPEITDAWGIPVPRFDVAWSDNERKMAKDGREVSAEMLEAAGIRDVEIYENDFPPGWYIHEMGGACMGRDHRTSVLNAYNQTHDIANLFVTDGACMSSSAHQNPSLTYMALTARACHYAVDQLKRGNI